MADVDLLQSAYREKLGRDASQQELQGWTSGQFGGGNVNDWLNQIANSDEARQRQSQSQQPQTITPQPDTSHGYAPGSGYSDQPGYEPGGVDPNYFNSLSNAYQQYLGRSAQPDELTNWWGGKFGYGAGAGNLNSAIDAIRNSGEAKAYGSTAPGASGGAPTTSAPAPQGGDLQGWLRSMLSGASSPQALAALEPQLAQRGIRLQKDSAGNVRGRLYMPDGSTVDVVNQWGQPWTYIDRGKGGGGGGGSSMPGDQYSDAYTRLLEQLFKGQGRLGGPDPSRQANIGALQNRASQLQQGNSLLTQQMDYLQKRFQDLQGPGYTGAENEVIKTSALDPIEQDHQQAKRMLANQLAARGHQPGSGVYEQAMLELDKQFSNVRGATQAQLTGNELARRENRNQRAESISGALAQIPEERNRELLDVMNAIDKLSSLSRSEEDSYARELSNLGPQRLQLAMQASNAGGVTPSSLGSLLTQIAGLNQTGQAYNAQNSNALWSSLGQLAAIIGRQSQYGLGG